MRSLLHGDFISQRRLVEFCDRLAVQAMINSISLSFRATEVPVWKQNMRLPTRMTATRRVKKLRRTQNAVTYGTFGSPESRIPAA